MIELLTFYDWAHREQSDREVEDYEEDVPQQAWPEALIVDTINVWHADAADPEDLGFFRESLDFWANIWSFILVSRFKNPLLLCDNDSL